MCSQSPDTFTCTSHELFTSYRLSTHKCILSPCCWHRATYTAHASPPHAVSLCLCNSACMPLVRYSHSLAHNEPFVSCRFEENLEWNPAKISHVIPCLQHTNEVACSTPYIQFTAPCDHWEVNDHVTKSWNAASRMPLQMSVNAFTRPFPLIRKWADPRDQSQCCHTHWSQKVMTP